MLSFQHLTKSPFQALEQTPVKKEHVITQYYQNQQCWDEKSRTSIFNFRESSSDATKFSELSRNFL